MVLLTAKVLAETRVAMCNDSNEGCAWGRCILVFFGGLLIVGGLWRIFSSMALLDYGSACLGIGVLVASLGAFAPCKWVKALSGGF